MIRSRQNYGGANACGSDCLEAWAESSLTGLEQLFCRSVNFTLVYFLYFGQKLCATASVSKPSLSGPRFRGSCLIELQL